ncbi:phosphoribosyltransferase family protein [Leuconostocaceae bacterium ESL0958]|nr:phosphoribosyltransferase family protein [Leuconostocaceae bacterium ESL0958]
MAAYKFQGDYRLALVFRKELTAFVRRLKRHYQANLVLPIPVSPTRYQQRGFHQVAGLLAPGLRQQGLVVAQEPLQPQSALTRAARLASAQPFAIAENWQPHLKGQRILLVDDVYTTGRTLQHAAACVLAAGAQAVFSCSLAR